MQRPVLLRRDCSRNWRNGRIGGMSRATETAAVLVRGTPRRRRACASVWASGGGLLRPTGSAGDVKTHEPGVDRAGRAEPRLPLVRPSGRGIDQGGVIEQ